MIREPHWSCCGARGNTDGCALGKNATRTTPEDQEVGNSNSFIVEKLGAMLYAYDACPCCGFIHRPRKYGETPVCTAYLSPCHPSHTNILTAREEAVTRSDNIALREDMMEVIRERERLFPSVPLCRCCFYSGHTTEECMSPTGMFHDSFMDLVEQGLLVHRPGYRRINHQQQQDRPKPTEEQQSAAATATAAAGSDTWEQPRRAAKPQAAASQKQGGFTYLSKAQQQPSSNTPQEQLHILSKGAAISAWSSGNSGGAKPQQKTTQKTTAASAASTPARRASTPNGRRASVTGSRKGDAGLKEQDSRIPQSPGRTRLQRQTTITEATKTGTTTPAKGKEGTIPTGQGREGMQPEQPEQPQASPLPPPGDWTPSDEAEKARQALIDSTPSLKNLGLSCWINVILTLPPALQALAAVNIEGLVFGDGSDPARNAIVSNLGVQLKALAQFMIANPNTRETPLWQPAFEAACTFMDLLAGALNPPHPNTAEGAKQTQPSLVHNANEFLEALVQHGITPGLRGIVMPMKFTDTCVQCGHVKEVCNTHGVRRTAILRIAASATIDVEQAIVSKLWEEDVRRDRHCTHCEPGSITLADIVRRPDVDLSAGIMALVECARNNPPGRIPDTLQLDGHSYRVDWVGFHVRGGCGHYFSIQRATDGVTFLLCDDSRVLVLANFNAAQDMAARLGGVPAALKLAPPSAPSSATAPTPTLVPAPALAPSPAPPPEPAAGPSPAPMSSPTPAPSSTRTAPAPAASVTTAALPPLPPPRPRASSIASTASAFSNISRASSVSGRTVAVGVGPSARFAAQRLAAAAATSAATSTAAVTATALVATPDAAATSATATSATTTRTPARSRAGAPRTLTEALLANGMDRTHHLPWLSAMPGDWSMRTLTFSPNVTTLPSREVPGREKGTALIACWDDDKDLTKASLAIFNHITAEIAHKGLSTGRLKTLHLRMDHYATLLIGALNAMRKLKHERASEADLQEVVEYRMHVIHTHLTALNCMRHIRAIPIWGDGRPVGTATEEDLRVAAQAWQHCSHINAHAPDIPTANAVAEILIDDIWPDDGKHQPLGRKPLSTELSLSAASTSTPSPSPPSSPASTMSSLASSTAALVTAAEADREWGSEDDTDMPAMVTTYPASPVSTTSASSTATTAAAASPDGSHHVGRRTQDPADFEQDSLSGQQ